MFGALQLEGCGFESTSKSPRRDPGQVLHSQLLIRFGVKLRFSVRAVVGSASEWESGRGAITSVQIQYNTIQYNGMRVGPNTPAMCVDVLRSARTVTLWIFIVATCSAPAMVGGN